MVSKAIIARGVTGTWKFLLAGIVPARPTLTRTQIQRASNGQLVLGRFVVTIARNPDPSPARASEAILLPNRIAKIQLHRALRTARTTFVAQVTPQRQAQAQAQALKHRRSLKTKATTRESLNFLLRHFLPLESASWPWLQEPPPASSRCAARRSHASPSPGFRCSFSHQLPRQSEQWNANDEAIDESHTLDEDE